MFFLKIISIHYIIFVRVWEMRRYSEETALKEIDARGHACPAPVLMAKREIESGEGALVVLVDNRSSADNVARFARNAGFSAEISGGGGEFRVALSKVGEKDAAAAAEVVCPAAGGAVMKGKVLFISTDSIGRGSGELGRVLAKSLINALAENDSVPEKIVLMNAGVRLACEGSDLVAPLNELECRGVEILACGTCLKYFDLADKLRAGKTSNAYEILNALLEGNVVPLA